MTRLSELPSAGMFAVAGPAGWYEQTGDPTEADGILDRLVHYAYRRFSAILRTAGLQW
ncbi:MAG: hypothetical protein JO323_12840 [Acidobacteriia bacterium]|nr:hypothetical protein [Terriglobia bacterium]